ncbi:hypothetical protein LSTR_LSTR002461 [Laodelphax striatellus]|uniref:Chitin-binding type-2 domain-containing protein n=1 Tax=Laodelphax striatellus TaxID=195883 RepID=A0A482X3E9_LAOST|nr:hypothetical protein LSTR_LSTR002461 [Laodelphax striatellus]
MVSFRVDYFVRNPRKCGLFHRGGVLVLLFIVDLRLAITNEKDIHSSEQYDPYRIHFQRESNSQNKSDSIRPNDWKPILHNETGYRRMYLTRVNVFESQKISNKTDLGQNLTGNTQDKKLPNLFRTLRLANHGREVDNFSDDYDDNSRQKKRYRHSKRVRVIKPPHFLVPPQKDEQPNVPENEARQFYRVYQAKYMKTPGYRSVDESSRESNWRTENENKDAIKRNPRIKKIRRKPTNYLRPPIITLTTTEQIFFIKPKETPPMSFIDNYPPSRPNHDEISGTTERNIQSVTRSLDENNITKPIKYRVMYPTTTEMNFINQTNRTSHPVYNTSDDFYTGFTPKTYNFANSPVTVYSTNDIFGLGDVSTNDLRVKSGKDVLNDSRIYGDAKFVMTNSGRDGRYYDEQSRSIESGGVYAVDPPDFSKDKKNFWSTTNFEKPSTSSGGSGTAGTAYRGLEISTINYRNLETSGDLPVSNTGRTYGGSENSTSYGGGSTTASYRGLEAGRNYGGTETTASYGNSEGSFRGSGADYQGADRGTSYRGPVSSTSYGGPVSSTASDNGQEIGQEISTAYRSSGATPTYKEPGMTTSAYIYSDEVWKTSSYIPDDSRSSFYITNNYKTTENKPSTLSDIQSGILQQEINDMLPNTTTTTSDNGNNVEEILEHTESYFESTKMDKNLMSPEVQKSGMTVSKLGLNPAVNRSGDGLHQWIARFNPEGENFKSSGRSKYGVDNSFDYQDSNFINPADRQVKLHVAESSHFRKGQTVEKGLLFQQNNVIPGEAGSDYPIFSKPPHNSRFMCKADGLRYVADVSSGCQVFYMCVGEGPGEPMLCPNGTLFSQDFLVCDWWYNVECRYKK